MPYLSYIASDKEEEISDLNAFIKKDKDDYTKGMNGINLGHVMRETAKYNNCDFVDIRDLDLLKKALNEQKDSGQDILLCSPQFIAPKSQIIAPESQIIAPESQNEDESPLTHLTNCLKIIKETKPYKKVMLPIGLYGYGDSHLTALVIEGDIAYFFEQLGEGYYKPAKTDLCKAVISAGYNFYKSTKPLTLENRLDCGTVTTHVITEAIQADSVNKLSQRINKKSPLFSAQEIDKQHKLDQQYARLALKDIQEGHRDDRNQTKDVILLQKLLSKAHSLNFEDRLSLVSKFWEAADKEDFVSAYKSPDNDDVLTIDDKLPEADQSQAWKDEVRKAVKEANQQLSHNFTEYQNQDHPNHLFFKDGNNEIAFANKQQAYAGGDQKAFDELCVTAVKLGKDTINFGKFEKHPEYKAMLYLACLKYGLNMSGNIPNEEGLKNSPQYAEIQQLQAPQKRKELQQKLKDTKKQYQDGMNNAYMEAKYHKAFDALKAAKDAYKTNKTDDNKKAIVAAQKDLEATDAYKRLQQQKKVYQDTLKEAADFYVQFGSGNPNDKSTPEERQQKLDKHLTNYNPKEFFTKDPANGPNETEKKQISKYSVVYQALQNRGNGK